MAAPRPPIRRLAALALSLTLGACTFSNGSGAPLGFSTSYSTGADGAAPRVLHGVRGSGAGNGWAVGEGGLALALVGFGSWREVPTGSTATLGGVSAADANHIFAVELGGDRVLTFDGHAWGPLGADRAGRAAAATWAAAPNDVWVVGDGIEHWDGTQWTQQVPPGTAFTSIAGSFPTDVWAVGPGGVQHYDGRFWSPLTVPAGAGTLAAVWSTGLYDVWIVGAKGTLLHGSGKSLALVAPGTTVDLTSVTGADPANIWMGGKDGTLVYWNGVTFTQIVTPAAKTINDLWLPPGGNLLLVDDTGDIVNYVR